MLARKFRPKTFAEMVGQGHVVQALENALTTQRLHHAYLFTGTRGVGKTTVSRILAKSLNCQGLDGQGGITATPCGVCRPAATSTPAASSTTPELDAASNRGVDEVQSLLEQAVYKPVQGRFKVFVIDEVHMLTNTRVQRDAEDARGAARVPQVRAGHHRPAEGAGHGAVALPAVQPAPDGARDGARAPDLGAADRAGCRPSAGAAPARARGARLDARRALR